MVIHDRISAFIYRVILLAIALTTVVFMFIAFTPAWPIFFSWNGLSTLAVFFIVLAEVIANAIGLPKRGKIIAPGVYSPIFMAALTMEISNVIAYATSSQIFFGFYFKEGKEIFIILSQIVLPIMFVLDYLFYGEKGTVKWNHALYWVVIPIFYFAYSYAAKMIYQMPSLPFPFTDCATYNEMMTTFLANVAPEWAMPFINFSIFLVIYVGLSYLLIFFNNLLGNNYNSKNE